MKSEDPAAGPQGQRTYSKDELDTAVSAERERCAIYPPEPIHIKHHNILEGWRMGVRDMADRIRSLPAAGPQGQRATELADITKPDQPTDEDLVSHPEQFPSQRNVADNQDVAREESVIRNLEESLENEMISHDKCKARERRTGEALEGIINMSHRAWEDIGSVKFIFQNIESVARAALENK